MAQRISPFQIGLFFLIGAAIAVGALLWVGATHFFEPGKTYVTFFKDSVGGLGPGAGVEYLGIKVGRVTAVGIAPDHKLIRVELKVNPDFKVKGMAVTLSQQGIMGGNFVAIDWAPSDIDKITPKIAFATKYPVIPSQPSGGLSRIENSVERVVKKIEAIDFKGLVADWQQAAQQADALLSDKDIRKTISNLREISADIHNLVGVLGKPGNPQKWQKSFADLAATAAAARQGTEALADRLEKFPPEAIPDLYRQLQQTLIQVDQVLIRVERLVHEFRESPGKVLTLPQTKEPFRR